MPSEFEAVTAAWCLLGRLDEQMIESLFGYTAARCSAKHEEAQSRSPSLGHHVLDPKRLQNMTILMKAVNATADQIYAVLMHGECSNKLPLMNQRIWTS